MHKTERAYRAIYPMDNPEGVRAFLKDYRYLIERAYTKADFDALNTVLDAMQAINEAKLTRKQKEALRLVYVEDMTQTEAAVEEGIAQSKVSERIERAVLNIAESQGYDEEVFREKKGH